MYNYYYVWEEIAPGGKTTFLWDYLSCSETGQYMIACGYDKESDTHGSTTYTIFYSDDYGATWTERIQSNRLSRLTLSGDGQTIIGHVYPYGNIVKSVNYGVSFSTIHTNSAVKTNLVCDSSCDKILYGTRASWTPVVEGHPYQSVNGGASWTSPQSGSYYYHGLGWSKNGTYGMLARDYTAQIGPYYSALWITKNGGTSWVEYTPISPSNDIEWSTVSTGMCSNDGLTFITRASTRGGLSANYLKKSVDGGSSWSDVAGSLYWRILSYDSTGDIIVFYNIGSPMRLWITRDCFSNVKNISPSTPSASTAWSGAISHDGNYVLAHHCTTNMETLYLGRYIDTEIKTVGGVEREDIKKMGMVTHGNVKKIAGLYV